MKRTKSLSNLAIICGAAMVGLALLHTTAVAQKAAPVIVTNTSSNPVPVTGGVSVTNTPTVDSRQSGSWSVGIDGTPTVGIDPTANSIKVAPGGAAELLFSAEFPLPAISSGGATLPNLKYSKVRVCANNHGNSDLIDVDIDMFIPDRGNVEGFSVRVDHFTVLAGGGSVCRAYEVIGPTLMVNLKNRTNTAGTMKMAVLGSN
jgi:hypothetical protein